MSEEFDLSDSPRESAPSHQPTLLDRLRQAAAKEVAKPNFRLVIPERPEISVLIDPNIEDFELKKLQEESTHKGKMDTFKFALRLIGHTTRGLYFGDEEVLSESGHPLTWASPEVKEMFGNQGTPQLTVKAAFGVDAHIISAAGEIVDRAGYGDEAETADPLKTS